MLIRTPSVIDRFVQTAVDRQLIGAEQAAALADEARERTAPVGQVAIATGMLTPTEVEIVEAFMAPEDMVSGYRLLDVLGQGALGVVYLAHQDRLQRDVAIKVILQSRISQMNVLQRFQKEATAIGRLQHPGIVAAFDSGTHRGNVFLVMELVRGIDLRERIDQGPIPIAHIVSILRQTASALAHAASQNIIHRDIKPANLMLSSATTGFDLPVGAPLVKVADFGLARFGDLSELDDDVSRLTMTGATLGTPMYCAPEQLTGDPVDHRADIYGLGATLFSMLSGVTPFETTKLPKLVAAKVTGESPRFDRLPTNLSPALRQLVVDMMQFDPEDRIGDYATLMRRIDEQIVAPDLTETLIQDPSDGPVASRRHLVVAMALTPLAIGLFGGLYLLNRESSPEIAPTTIETVWSHPLFDGVSMAGWINKQSVWSVKNDIEGSRVLAGKGTISTVVPDPPADVVRSAIATGLRVRVDLRDAVAAEVQFAFNEDRRWSVRVAEDDVSLGFYLAGDDEFTSTDSIKLGESRDPDVANWQEVQMQRHADRWFVLFDGQPLGSFPTEPPIARNMLQLVSTGGEAYFSDITVFGLEKPN